MIVFKRSLRATGTIGLMWFGLSGITFIYIHPIVAMIPGLIALSCIGSVR